MGLPPAARRVADELLRRYGLGPALQIEVAPGGLLNQNLLATTARGAFFLKGYRYVDPEPIRREHDLIQFAARQGVPALEPLADPSSKTYLRVGGRWWAVFPRVAARQPEPDQLGPPEAYAIGRCLGQIHVALATLPASQAARFPPKLTWESGAAIQEMGEYEVIIARRPTLDPFDQHTLSSFGYRRTLLAGGVPNAQTFAGLPVQVLHGDFHHGNLFFAPATPLDTASGQRPGRGRSAEAWTPLNTASGQPPGRGRSAEASSGTVQHVIDWELACTGPRAWELIRVLDLSLRLEDDLESGAARLRALIHGYAGAAPLTAEECEAMPDLYWAARVHSLWVYEEHYRKGSAKTDPIAMEDLAKLHWLAANRPRIATTLREALASAPGIKLAG